MASYAQQDDFFARAYRTGTDHWTSIPFNRRAHELALYLPKGALILDIGAGRGRLLFELAELDLRAIGLENNPELVARGNSEIQAKGLAESLRFLHGSVLDIPLADQSFDGLVDVGLLQHIDPEDYTAYVAETTRVLRQGGYFFLVVLSKNTAKYLSWHPQSASSEEGDISDFESEGMRYHFFSDAELKAMFEPGFEVRHIEHDLPHGPGGTVFAVVLLKKK